MDNAEARGIEIAKGIRGCSTMFFVPVIAIAVGIEVGKRTGWCLGILAFVGAFWLSSIGLRALINRTTTELTIQDCIMPALLSLVCSIVFLPLKIISFDIFGPLHCMFAGIIFSVCLLGYRAGRIQNPFWLTFPFLTFVYELLPVNIPGPIDDILSLSADTFVSYLAWTKREGSLFAVYTDEQSPKQLENNDVVDVVCDDNGESGNLVSQTCRKVHSVVAGANEILDEVDGVKSCIDRIKSI